MNNSNKAKIRQEKIREMLFIKDMISVHEFCEQLHASQATIRNDLTTLEKNNVLKRVLGGAISTEGTPHNTSYHLRSSLFKDEKVAIAQYAVKNFLKDDMIIALDAGTTCKCIAQALMEANLHCHVITNSFEAAAILVKSKHIDLYMAGGRMDREHGSFHDDNTLQTIQSIHSDLYFLSPNGVDAKAQITSSSIEENIIKRAFVKQAATTIVVADHSKIGKSAIKVICQLEDIQCVITDQHANKKNIEELRNMGIQIHQSIG